MTATSSISSERVFCGLFRKKKGLFRSFVLKGSSYARGGSMGKLASGSGSEKDIFLAMASL